jgi:RNA polymerase sigma-70 factor (ECF subfamily)
MSREQQEAQTGQSVPTAPHAPSRAESVERLFREHNDALIRFLLPRLRSRSAALEVAQEAYVRLLSLDEPGAVSYLRAFLFKTAANLAVDRLRRGVIHTQVAALPLFHEFMDDRTPERRVAGAQQIDRLHLIIRELPPKCARAFLLNRLHDMSFSAVASEMNLSERMVRTYVVRALLYCRARLDGDAPLAEESGP